MGVCAGFKKKKLKNFKTSMRSRAVASEPAWSSSFALGC